MPTDTSFLEAKDLAEIPTGSKIVDTTMPLNAVNLVDYTWQLMILRNQVQKAVLCYKLCCRPRRGITQSLVNYCLLSVCQWQQI